MEIRKASFQVAMNRARSVNPKLFDRVMQIANVGPITQCWNWTRSLNRDGYGGLKVGQKNVRAHRIAHDLFHPEAGNNLVRHLCHNPACVNPAHLRTGTPADNAEDRRIAGRGGNLKGAANGRAKLTNEQVLEIRASTLDGKQLGMKYGISKVMACRIRRGNAWKHI